MMIHHTTLLLIAAWALLIFNEKEVYCGIVVVSSSSSDFETICNGMRCPSGSSCAVSVNAINGNKNSDTTCYNNGQVVRQENINVSNGVMCIKNLTMMGEEVNVEQSCRNLSRAEIDDMEQKQAEFHDAMEERSKLFEKQMHKLEKDIKEKTEDIGRALKMQADAREREAKARAEELEARMAEMHRKLEALFG